MDGMRKKGNFSLFEFIFYTAVWMFFEINVRFGMDEIENLLGSLNFLNDWTVAIEN